MTRRRLQRILDGDDRRFGRSVALFIQFLILLSAVSLAIETIDGLPDWLQVTLAVQEYVVVGFFIVEYGLRLASARPKWRYVLSFWGIVDLLAILPTLLATGVDARALRVLRLLRLFRLLKLARYNRAVGRLAVAFRVIRDELAVFAVLAVLVLYLSAVGIYYFEHKAQPDKFGSIFQALWWAVVSLTTVGYGDAFPITPGGQIFTVFVLIIGLGVVAVPTGLIAAALTDQRHAEAEEARRRLRRELAEHEEKEEEDGTVAPKRAGPGHAT